MQVKCFAKVQNWHVVEGLYRFHTIHMTILFDMSIVLITYIFGSSLIKTFFEAKDIRSNWKIKTMLFFWTLGFLFKQCHPTTIVQLFYKKVTGTDVGCSSDEDE